MPGCVILAAGKGTRLGPLGARMAKAMLPVGGRPFLELLVARCLASGLRPVVVAISHHAEDIRAHFADVRWGDAGLILHEALQKGTGGDVLDAMARVPAGWFVVCNGDTVLDIDMRAVLAFQDEAPDRGVIVLTRRRGVSSLEQDLLPVLIERRMLRAFDNGLRYFLDFGTPDRLAQLRREHEAILRVLTCEKGERV